MTARVSSKKIFHMTCLLLFLVSCGHIPPLENWAKSGIGRNIDEIRATHARPSSYASQIGWKEKAYDLPNGNWVFVSPEPRCLIHWEVNMQGVIVGYRFEGQGCK